jgi:aspartyl-tRNA synthetase
VRPFYHMRHPDNPALTRSFDLIANGLEITTGAQREHRYDVLVKQALERGLPKDPSSSTLTSSATAARRTAVSAWGCRAC